AAGVLNLWRLLGAGIITVIVFQFMSRYDHEESPEWMWYSIILAVTVLVISTLWTVLSLRPKRGTRVFLPRVTNGAATAAIRSVTEMTTQRVQITRNYLFFLIALAFAIAAMSSMQIYALFFLQDVVGLENPANGADQLVVIIAGSAGITVLPAGLMADRFGRDKLFFIAGTLGAISSALLLFVDSLGPVLLIGVLIGLAVGLFLTLTWVVANDLVSKQSAAKELGYTSIATLTGAALARFSGVGIDILNEVSENLGYQAILVSVSAAFIISSLLLSRVASNPSKAISGSDSPASLSAAN
ncbi:MAG: MFS transporter, partial [Dehalococcoidia bacterium]